MADWTPDRHEILRNEAPWEAHLVEGPFILRRGDWFHLFYSADACCGRNCNYKLGVARSRTLLGSWERHPGNPILAGNDHWKCPGPGSIVTDAAGRTLLLYHAYHPIDFEHVGRQGLLDEVTWDAQGWPAINAGRGPSHTAASSADKPAPVVSVADEFRNRVLDPAWQWPWDQEQRPALDSSRGGWLVLSTAAAPSAAPLTVAARPAPAGTYTAMTSIDAASLPAGLRAGLSAFGNRNNLLAVTVERSQPDGPGRAAGGLTIVAWQVQKGARTTLATERVEVGQTAHLRLQAVARSRFEFAVSADGRTWKPVGTPAEGGYLPPWDLAVRIALIADGAPRARARFGRFLLTPAPTGR